MRFGLSRCLSLLALVTLASCSKAAVGGPRDSEEPGTDSGPNPTVDASLSGDGGGPEQPADATTPSGPLDGGDHPPPLVCPAPLPMPTRAACGGVSLLDPASIEKMSDGIATSSGPDGSTATRVSDGQTIDLVDSGCLQLGKDGADVTLSMWLKATGPSQIIGNTDQYARKQGFILTISAASDGLLKLVSSSAPPSGAMVSVDSAPFAPNQWVHVVVRYDNRGAASNITLDVNLTETSGAALPDVYNANWRIGDAGYGTISAFEVSDLVSYPSVLSDHEIKALYLTKPSVSGTSAELSTAIARIGAHVRGEAALADAALASEVSRFVGRAPFLDTDQNLTEQALLLVDSYERLVGPLFMTAKTKNGFARVGTAGDGLALERAMATVQQTILEQLFTPANVEHCQADLAGKSFKTATYFPGAAPPPEDANKSYEVTISASVPAFWGRPVAFATEAVRRPTGLYLSPGSIGRVTVPPELVNAGYSVLVGAHTVDHSAKTSLKRLDRVTKTFPITKRVTTIANPLGGGVYIVVPYLADQGLVKVRVSGVIEAPFFSKKSFDTTKNEQWLVRRMAPAPWADFETDKFMMQVPSSWSATLADPASLLSRWDSAMDGVSELLGYPPEKRNRTVLYEQVDVQIRHGAFGIGYPQVNNTYDPNTVGRGNPTFWMLTDPTAFEVDYHELGHSQLISMFRGETEAIVNFPHAYVQNVKFGMAFEQAFRESFGPSYGSDGMSPDDAAINWMITDNFRGDREMDYSNSTKNEFRYQQRGYAKYADMYRVFGWNALRDFFRQESLDYMSGIPSDGLDPVDSRILRMSVAAHADLRPLIYFWGIHPVNASALAAKLSEQQVGPSSALKDHLTRYKTIAPKNNADFLAHYARVYPKGCPSGSDPDYGCGYYEARKAQFNETQAVQIQAQIQKVLSLYFP